MMIRDNITVLRTKNTLDTICTLSRFVKSMDTLFAKTDEADFYVEGGEEDKKINKEELMELLTKKIEKSDIQIVRSLWSCFPGITTETADEYIKHFKLSDILRYKVSKETITAAKLSSGRKISAKVVRSLTNIDKPVQIRMLSRVPGISIKTANEIINQTDLPNLLSYEPGAISIIKVGKSKKNLGESRANNILKLFNYERPRED